MKKWVVLVLILLLIPMVVYPAAPNFKVHKLGYLPNTQFAGETHIPIAVDYDNDGDTDIYVIDRYGQVIVYENLLIP